MKLFYRGGLMKEFYVYRFKNEENEIIYVGKTKNLKQRLSGHFGKQGHLPEKCYKEVRKVEFLTFEKRKFNGDKRALLHIQIPTEV